MKSSGHNIADYATQRLFALATTVIGAICNLQPDLYAGVIAEVPFASTVNVHFTRPRPNPRRRRMLADIRSEAWVGSGWNRWPASDRWPVSSESATTVGSRRTKEQCRQSFLPTSILRRKWDEAR